MWLELVLLTSRNEPPFPPHPLFSPHEWSSTNAVNKCSRRMIPTLTYPHIFSHPHHHRAPPRLLPRAPLSHNALLFALRRHPPFRPPSPAFTLCHPPSHRGLFQRSLTVAAMLAPSQHRPAPWCVQGPHAERHIHLLRHRVLPTRARCVD